MTKKSREKLKYLENEKSFYYELKSIFHNFWRVFIEANKANFFWKMKVGLQDAVCLRNYFIWKISFKFPIKWRIRQCDRGFLISFSFGKKRSFVLCFACYYSSKKHVTLFCPDVSKWIILISFIMLLCERPGFDFPLTSYQQISQSPRAARPSILPRSVNQYQVILGLTPVHRQWGLFPALLVWPTAKYLRSRISRLHPNWLVQRNLGSDVHR